MLEHTAVVLLGAFSAMTKFDAIFKAGVGFAAFRAQILHFVSVQAIMNRLVASHSRAYTGEVLAASSVVVVRTVVSMVPFFMVFVTVLTFAVKRTMMRMMTMVVMIILAWRMPRSRFLMVTGVVILDHGDELVV